MKSLKYLLRKEFAQIRRNKAILRMMFVMPIIQLVVLPFAANYDVKDVKLVILDQDKSSMTKECIHLISASKYFKLVAFEEKYTEALKYVEADQADIILEFPSHCESDLIREDKVNIYMAVNAINGMKANVGAQYLQRILSQYNQKIRQEWLKIPAFPPEPIIITNSRFWFNPQMSYKLFMVPGILTLLLTMIGSFLASLNIVREKEIGTIEQINVTPIPKYIFIMGKLIPFWLMSQIVLTLGLIVARVVYQIDSWNALTVIYLFNSIYMVAVLGLGLFISTITDNQQQAVLISFFLMMVFILLGGLYTSTDSMPEWAKWISRVNPVTYYVEVMRMSIIRHSNFTELAKHFYIISGIAVFTISAAIFNYRKRG